MDMQDVCRTKNYVIAMIGKEGRKYTEEYLTSKELDEGFRRQLVKAGILKGGKLDFSELPVRKADIFTSASISETQSIVSRLIKRDGIDYTIADFAKELSKQIQKKLVEAGLMSVTSKGKSVNVSGLYCLANLGEKSSNAGSIQPVTSKASPQ